MFTDGSAIRLILLETNLGCVHLKVAAHIPLTQ